MFWAEAASVSEKGKGSGFKAAPVKEKGKGLRRSLRELRLEGTPVGGKGFTCLCESKCKRSPL